MSYGDIDEKFMMHWELWKDRLEYIYHEFSGFGWGMDDYITEEYYSIPWLEED